MSLKSVAGLLALSVILVVSACVPTVREPAAVFGEPVPRDSAIAVAVNEYFHYRKLAVVARDAEILWDRFPELRHGEDLATGINTEGWLAMRSATARSLADVIYDLDRYDRVRMRATGDDVIVRVHGLEQYIQADFSNGTAGEFILDLYLRRQEQIWTVVKTDEMTLAEFHEATGRP